jgi:hypothetical protein
MKEQILKTIREICPELQKKTCMGNICMETKPHLEHLLRTISTARCGIDAKGLICCRPSYEERGTGDKNMQYDLTLSVEENLDTNPELCSFIHSLICE